MPDSKTDSMPDTKPDTEPGTTHNPTHSPTPTTTPAYVILTDSTCDMPPGMADKLEVSTLPLTYTIDGIEYDDIWGGVSNDGLVSPTAEEFYELMRQGKTATTSQIPAARFRRFFEPFLQAGSDIIYIAFSSGISGTYEQAMLAARELEALYPTRRIVVIDSLLASMAEALFVYLATLRRRAGESFEGLVDYLMEIRLKVNGWVTVGDLHSLRRSGRLNAPATLFGSLLDLKPIITMDRTGNLIANRVVRGYKKSLRTIVDLVAEHADDPTNNPIFMSHAGCPEVLEDLIGMLRERFATKQIVSSYIGPVIGAHIGPGTVAVYFVGAERGDKRV